MDKEDRDEVSFDYSVENDGKTHILVVEFPDNCDEECFLLALKTFLKAQNENLLITYADQSKH